MCTPGLQCGSAGCKPAPPTVACDLACGEWFLAGLMGFKGEFEVVDPGKRAVEIFDAAMEASLDGVLGFGQAIWIRPHGMCEAFASFGVHSFDLITQINGLPVDAMRMRLLAESLEQGIETDGTIMFLCPHTGERWKAEWRIVKKHQP